MLHIDSLHTVLDTDHGLVRAVDDLALSIERGETFALVGESGCGKSMTALSILRLLPDNGRVAEGTIEIGDTDVVQLPEARMRDVRGRRVSIIFQEPATSLNPVMKVGDQIVEVIERHTAIKGAAARAKAVEWLTRVGIPEPARRADDYPFQLSGGQKQRVMIAIALAADPEIVIADEPTTALDVTIQAQILRLLKKLSREHEAAVIVITHDLGVVAGMCQRILVMYAGRIVESGPAKPLFARPHHPYTVGLLKSVPRLNEPRADSLQTIMGLPPDLAHLPPGCAFAPRCFLATDECWAAAPELFPTAPGRHSACFHFDQLREPSEVPA